MLAQRKRLLPVALVLAVAIGGCGKASSQHGITGASIRTTSVVAPQGAVSVVTRNTTRLGGLDVASDAAAIARTVYPALTPATRPSLVVIADEADWPAALAASVLSSGPTSAPILYMQNHELPAITTETLRALAPTGAPALGGTQVLELGSAVNLPSGFIARTLPLGRPAPTAAAIAKLLQSAVGVPRQVIVVPANAPRSLMMPVAGLSAESGAPILYATPSQLPEATTHELASLNDPSIYVVDASALKGAALHELRHLGSVTIATADNPGPRGQSPISAAIDLARFTDGTFGWGIKEPGHGLVFANLSRPFDAPAAALLSATGTYGPLLLLQDPELLPKPLISYLQDIQPAYTSAPEYRPVRGVYNHGWIIGDETVISAITQAEIDSLLEISPRSKSTEEQPAGQVE